MNKNYFLKKKILAVLAALGKFSLQNLVRLYKLIFAKRTILFVTDKKIRSISFGPIAQFAIIIAFVWAANLFNQSLRYREIINSKSEEISKLQAVNGYFQEEFSDVNEKLRKINEYLISITGNTHKVKGQKQPQFQTPKNIKEKDLSTDDQHTLNEIKEASQMLAGLHSFTRDRIKTIEDAITITGLNLKKTPLPKAKEAAENPAEKEISLNGKNGITNKQGGPLVALDSIEDDSINLPADNMIAEDEIQKHLEKAEFSSDIDRLTMLENLVRVMPLARPMKHYYVSSGFGSRTDPITGRYAIHQGLDFVGPFHEKVISPSSGKVILAGKFSGYGNAVVIDHGFGITTRYGHLAAVSVETGQIVKKGQAIATQGSTGRSTGSHLHYEVRYRNIPLNPKKFLEAGDTLFNDDKTTKYVNS